MLKHDPLAPLIRAEIAERMRWAEQRRPRRAAAAEARLNRQSESTGRQGPLAQLHARSLRLWSSLIHELLRRGRSAMKSLPEK